MATNGMPLTADSLGLARLLDRYAEELPVHQEWREFVQNAFDADATRVVIDGYADPNTGRNVLRISDDGEGMNEEQLRSHLTTLHASGKGRNASVRGNFGVGARIAGLSRNTRGVVYASRQEGADRCAWLRKFPDGSYGLEQFDVDDGTWSTITEPDDGMLPPLVEDTGTAVMLHGSSGGDTWTETTPFEMARYLQERYYKMPVPVFLTRTLAPLEDHYSHASASCGYVSLKDGSVCEWWVFDDLHRTLPGWALPRRGIGIVFQDEVLDFAVGGSQKVARYKRFGLYGKSVLSRVAIVVHPSVSGGWRMNQERSEVITKNGRRIDWDDTGQQFADAMPEEIRELFGDGPSSDFTEELARRLDPEWFKHVNPTPTRKPQDDGDVTTSGERTKVRRRPSGQTGQKREEPTSPPQEARPLSEKTGQVPAVERHMARVTQPVWVPVGEWSGDQLCAASYSPRDNVVLLQAGHWIFEANVDLVASKKSFPRQIVAAAVEKAYGIEMAAKVTHILSMKARQVTDSVLEQFLSDEALTSAACGLMAVSLMIDEELARVAAS